MQYVPYRESKLTTLLRQSLGGNSFTLMIACVTPIDLFVEENISTLSYATRAAKIRNAPTLNMDPKQRIIMEQKQKIEALQKELQVASDQIRFLTDGGCICGGKQKSTATNESKPSRSMGESTDGLTSLNDPNKIAVIEHKVGRETPEFYPENEAKQSILSLSPGNFSVQTAPLQKQLHSILEEQRLQIKQ